MVTVWGLGFRGPVKITCLMALYKICRECGPKH